MGRRASGTVRTVINEEERPIIPLLILGLLKDRGQASAYELLGLIDERDYRYLIHVTKGSFYYNLQKLAEKELVRLVKTVSVNGYPEQHIYEITDAGSEHFEQLMGKYASQTDDITLAFYMTTLFAHEYDPARYRKALEDQIRQTRQKIEEIDRALREKQDVIYTTAKSMMENVKAHHELNLKWFEDLHRQTK
ncbi:PadR family transcriptional regulator [Saccharibacillus sp. O23]|nr:PadR family transcriptional regulator [Saccharibacillus sp. O23]